MTCCESLDLLHKRLDGEAVPLAALEQHLRECAACRDLHRAGDLLAEVSRRLPQPLPRADLSGRIVQAVLAERRPILRRFPLIAVGALAASLLIAVALYFSLPGPTAQLIVQKDPKARIPVVEQKHDTSTSTPSLNESVADVRSAMASLT